MSKLYDQIAEAITNPATAAFIAETEYTPVTGPATPIAPPTYASATGQKTPEFAVSEEAFLPEADGSGWLRGIRRGDGGVPLTGRRLIVNSVQAESGRAETATWEARERLGLALPGVVLTPPPDDVVTTVLKKAQIVIDSPEASAVREALRVSASTWTLAHRQVDAWLKFATDPATGKQVWAGGPVKELITDASADPADRLYRHFPNSALYGFWLSAGVARRVPHARAYSSEIVGYNAFPVTSGATKLDPMGGASASTTVSISPAGDLAMTSGKGAVKPSTVGLGQVPEKPAVHGFVCESVVQHSAVTLQTLRRLRFGDDAAGHRWEAAATVLTFLGILGRSLANEDTFLRSGCSLVTTADRWGVRTSGSADIAPVEAFTVADAAEATREAISAAAALGLEFAEPIEVQMSPEQAGIIASRVVNDLNKQAEAES